MEHDRTGNRTVSTSIPRRRVLAAAAATTAGGLVTAEPVAAEESGFRSGFESAPPDYPTVDLRDGGLLSTSSAPTSDLPSGADEVVLYVHGWLERVMGGGGDNQAFTFERALAENGREAPTVAVRWSSNSPNFFGVETDADEVGVELASVLEAYMADNPSTSVRLVGHSLGGRVALSTLNELDGTHTVDDVVLLGASIATDSVCNDGRFAPGIRESTERVHNYFSENDFVVGTIFRLSNGLQPGLGATGSSCGGFFFGGSTPANYTDVDVTRDVETHFDYGKAEVGCVPQIVANLGE